MDAPDPPNPFFALDLAVPPPAARSRRRALYDQIKQAILDGRLAPGLQLPASRALAAHLGVSRNSVLATYDRLLGEGHIVSRPGAGSFVASTARPPPARAEGGGLAERLAPAWREAAAPLPRARAAGLALGVPDESLLPETAWRRLYARARRRRSGGPVDPFGAAGLRAAIAGHVSSTRAVACGPDDVLVTCGAQQAFDLLARVLVEPGRTLVAVEDPGYPPLRAALAAAGAQVHPVPVDAEGLSVEALPPTAAAVCVTPSHQFPLGVPMSARRRLALLEWAEAHGAVVIEDDYDGEFRFEDRPLDALQTLDRQGRVFYVGTFSKCLSPALRLGFLVFPPWARAALGRAKQIADGGCGLAEQETLAAFIAEGGLARHVRRMRKLYAGRRGALSAALAAHCGGALTPFPAVAGLHLAARTSPAVEAAAARSLAAFGVRPISEFALLPEAPRGLVFGYGVADEAVIAAAIGRLGALIAPLGSDCQWTAAGPWP